MVILRMHVLLLALPLDLGYLAEVKLPEARIAEQKGLLWRKQAPALLLKGLEVLLCELLGRWLRHPEGEVAFQKWRVVTEESVPAYYVARSGR